MSRILLETIIHAPIEVCFDLSRSIELHQLSTKQTKEKAIAGCTQGLISKGEFVTWEAIHFGIRQQLTTHISEMVRPLHFRDEQLKGIFRSMVHDHYFSQQGDQVLMKDVFVYRSPLGPLGWLADLLILKSYMTRLLLKRNKTIKIAAENGEWKAILKDTEQL